jgi:hypothetical protein
MNQLPVLARSSTLSAEVDCRCLCGSLLARVIEGNVELKCRRCKRTLVVPLPPPAGRGRAQPVQVIPVGEAG